jgi:predicted MPP superfamily phosphohydrolase
MPWFIFYALILAAPLAGMYYYNVKQILNAGEELWNWNRVKARSWLVLFTCLVNLLPVVSLVTFWIGGRAATRALTGEARVLDYLLVYPFWISLVITVQLFLLFVIWHLVRVLLRNISGNNLKPRITLSIFLFVVSYSCLTVYTDTWTIRVNEREVKLPQEFSGLDGVRIVQIADVQGDARTTPEFIRTLVDKSNTLLPDVILFGGDVVTSGSKYVGSTIAELSGLRARYAKIAAIGDHDMFSGKQPIVEGMTRAGFTVLEDSSIRLTINKVPVVVTGLVFTYRQRPSNDILSTATDNGNDNYKIFLVHQPRVELVQYASEKGYHLFTAGHTHGGAIAFGIPGIFLVAPSRFETKYFTGFYEVGNMLVSVNNGLGHTLAPIRFQAPVEITLIRLVK